MADQIPNITSTSGLESEDEGLTAEDLQFQGVMNYINNERDEIQAGAIH
jgi:hypothetical protein